MVDGKPDYEGFCLEVRNLELTGINIHWFLLEQLARKYGTPVPSITECEHGDTTYRPFNNYLERCIYCGNEREIR